MDKPYLCSECGEPMREVLACVPYPECGLDDVTLHQVPVRECVNQHRDVQIPAIDELHEVLAEILVSQPSPLKGQDVRFLRKHLGYTARLFSAIIGLNYVTLSKFENERKRIPRKVDALVRLFCAQALSERTRQPLPRPIIPVLKHLESAPASFNFGTRRLEHIGLGADGRAAQPRHIWQEKTA